MGSKAGINADKLPSGARSQRVAGGQDPSGKMAELDEVQFANALAANTPQTIEDPATGQTLVIVKQRADGLTFLPPGALCPEKSPNDPAEKRGYFKTINGNRRQDN